MTLLTKQKQKKIMNKLYDRVHYDNLKFEYIGPNKDASFDEYKDSKEPFKCNKK